MSLCWTPSDHTYTGDCAGQLVLPHYITMPDRIRIFDRAVRNRGWRRAEKKLWRTALSRAAYRWGYEVEIVELRRELAYRAEGITVDAYVHTPPYGPQGGYGGFGLAPIDRPEMSEFDQATWDAGKGFALVHENEVRAMFAGRNTGRVSGVLCHEIGHALGFGHSPDPDDLMYSAPDPPYQPNDDELYELRRYWGTA